MGQVIVVGRVGDIPEGACAVVGVNGKDVAIFHVDGKYYAIDDRCPHAGSSLSLGTVENLVVTCAWHHWRFRLTDGAWADNPRIKTGCYTVEIVGGEIHLLVPDSSG